MRSPRLFQSIVPTPAQERRAELEESLNRLAGARWSGDPARMQAAIDRLFEVFPHATLAAIEEMTE